MARPTPRVSLPVDTKTISSGADPSNALQDVDKVSQVAQSFQVVTTGIEAIPEDTTLGISKNDQVLSA